jgi:hypothetical protein
MESRRGLNDCAKKEGLCPLQKMLASFLKKNHSKNNSGKGLGLGLGLGLG